MADEKVKPVSCSFVDGVGSSQAIDTTAEIVDLAGIDCSSFVGGALNWEHKSDVPASIVGKVLEYKKIFSEKDCENDRHKYYWDKCKTPYLYVMGRLFDDKKPSAVECAALFKDDAEHPDEHPMVGFSIEGSKVDKKGMIVTKSIARKMTITGAPANKQCVAELIPGSEAKSSTNTDSIFKSEASYTIQLLSKAEVPGSKIPSAHPPQGPSKAVKGAPGWQHSGGGNFSHPEHGVVSVVKEGSQFNVKHGGGLAGVNGKKGSFSTAQEAGAHAGNYIRSLGQGKTQAPAMHNRPSPSMDKSLMGGMMGAGLPQESTDKKNKRGLFNPDVDKIQGSGAIMGGGMAKSGEKSPNIGKVRQKGTFEQKGVHMPPLSQAGGGESVMGSHVRNPSDTGSGSKEMARRHAQVNLRDLKAMPKPNLGKGETGHEKGIATKPNPQFKEGTSAAGMDVKLKDFASAKKQSVGRMMQQEKIKPKLVASEKNGNLKKAMTAGSGMAAPGNLIGGAALAPESLDRKMKKAQWLARAEQAYNSWAKKEQFENFMAKHMPSLTKYEIIALGQTLALRKSLRAEKSLKKMITDQGQDSWVKKKEK